eukprot:TRINITY_DN13264_c0_g2_i1.p1 TRINITY_DN13264_c0_g2~~TRINITY_DN13264_c0_g2_i1.p1  ORF type:complete len:655 (-),score=114.68 TRINITY_DN13264_c0_g2_i1:296-2260(-)
MPTPSPSHEKDTDMHLSSTAPQIDLQLTVPSKVEADAALLREETCPVLNCQSPLTGPKVDRRIRELLSELSYRYESEVTSLRAKVEELSRKRSENIPSGDLRSEDCELRSDEGLIPSQRPLNTQCVASDFVRNVSDASSAAGWDETDSGVVRVAGEIIADRPEGEMRRQTSDSTDAENEQTVETVRSPVSQPKRHSQAITLETLEEEQAMQMRAFRSMVDSKGERFEGESIHARIGNFLLGDSYETAVSLAVVVNLFHMAFELQYEGITSGFTLGYPRVNADGDAAWPGAKVVFEVLNFGFMLFFTVDVASRILVLGIRFWKAWMNWLDVTVVIITLMEDFGEAMALSPGLLRMLRLGKLFRITRLMTHTNVLDSLNLILKCIRASVGMLCWSLFLLAAIQFVFCMAIGYLAAPFIDDTSNPEEHRFAVYKYYGTYTRSIFTMFECLFANWGPPGRILIEYVSEWFAIFFLFYRCIIGFAVLNVVNAVFVQQTMRVAHADEEIAFKRKLEAQAAYTRKLQQLFHKLDESGDGEISWDEFSQMLVSPQLKFWMSELEFESHDLVGLFGLLDDGDECISIDEFMDGVVRLKGLARNVDVAQLLVLCRRLDEKLESVVENVQSLQKASGKTSTDKKRKKKQLKASFELAQSVHETEN